MAIISDIDSYCVYAEESDYGQAPGTISTYLGVIEDVAPLIDNNMREEYGVGQGRTPQGINAGLLDVSIGISAKVVNGNFLKLALGTKSGTGTAADPYVYAIANAPPTITVQDAFNLSTDQVLNLLGTWIKSCKIKLSLNAPILASFETVVRTVSKATSGYQTLSGLTDPVYYFTGGAVETPSGTALAEIQDGEFVVIDNGTKNYGELASRLQLGVPGIIFTGGTFNARMRDGTFLDWVLTGGSGATAPSTGTPAAKATVRLNFTNGANKYIRIVFTSAYCTSWKGTQASKEAVMEGISFRALSVAATEQVTA